MIILCLSLISIKSAYSQLPPSTMKFLTDAGSTERVKKENYDLQKFVEDLYKNSSKIYNKQLSVVEPGDYIVVIQRGNNSESTPARTKDLKDIPIESLEEFTYKKSATYGAIYGTFGYCFGMVFLKLKE